MIKRLYLAFALLVALVAPSLAAGTITLSMSQQFDSLGNPLNGGKLYFFQAGTTTPQSAYSDSGLTLALPNPITLDSAGRVPQFFLADGSIKIRLTNAAGVTQVAADGILVIGASSGGGGGSPVDATTVLATGDLKARYGTGALTGFVRANGRTIGSATSGATERANADCQELFEYLWGEDANLVVSTGRGVSAAADWAANKTIALPDWRGRVIAGLDDMGGTAAGRLTATYFGAVATVLGAVGQSNETNTLAAANLPPITSTGINTISVGPGPTLTSLYGNGSIGSFNTSAGGSPLPTGGALTGSALTGSNSISVVSTGTSSTPLRTVQPTMLASIYIKL